MEMRFCMKCGGEMIIGPDGLARCRACGAVQDDATLKSNGVARGVPSARTPANPGPAQGYGPMPQPQQPVYYGGAPAPMPVPGENEYEDDGYEDDEYEEDDDGGKKKKTVIIAVIASVSAVLLVLAGMLIYKSAVQPGNDYKEACRLMDEGNYDAAIDAFEKLDGYKDSKDKIKQCETAKKDAAYDEACRLMAEGKFDEAIAAFTALNGYKDSKQKIEECETGKLDVKYNEAMRLMNEGKYDEAIAAFTALDGYKDSRERIEQCKAAARSATYAQGLKLMEEGKYEEAYAIFVSLGTAEANEKAREAMYLRGMQLMNLSSYLQAIECFEKADGYQDSKKQILEAKYHYVLANQNNADDRVKTFVKELKNAGYSLIVASDLTEVTGGSTSAMHLHLFSAGAVVAPTCSAEGYTTYNCTCGAVGKAKPTAKTAHQYTGGTCTTPSTCKVCGASSGILGDHVWGTWAAVDVGYHAKTCTVCGEMSALEEHVKIYVEEGEGHIAQCTICGHKFSHSYDIHQYDENGICTLCGAVRN